MRKFASCAKYLALYIAVMGPRAKCHPGRTTREQLNTLLREDPQLTLDQLSAKLKVTVQRIRILAQQEGWEMEYSMHWERA